MKLVREINGKKESVELSDAIHVAAYKAKGWTEAAEPKPRPKAKAKTDE